MKVVNLNMTLKEDQRGIKRHFSVFAVWVVWWGGSLRCMDRCCRREMQLEGNRPWNPLFVGN